MSGLRGPDTWPLCAIRILQQRIGTGIEHVAQAIAGKMPVCFRRKILGVISRSWTCAPRGNIAPRTTGEGSGVIATGL